MFRPITLTAILLICCTGCTTFTITQTDESPGERTITTVVKATSIISSSQSVAKLKALQTDKTQSFGSDSIGQQAGTNIVEILNSLSRLIQSARPTP